MKKILSTGLLLGALVVLAAVFFYFNRVKGPAAPLREARPAVFTLKFGHDLLPDSAQHVAARKFAQIVDQRSRGQLRIDIYPDQQLGNDHQMIEAARAGELAIILAPTAKLSSLLPSIQYVDLPFIFPSREDAYELLDNEPGRMLLDQLTPFGLVGVAFWESGFKQFTANRPIRVPADFQGLKIRTMKSRIITDQFRLMGATPIPIDFQETFQALRDGVIDGQENPLVSIVNRKFYQVQSDLTISNHAYLGYVFAFSKKVLDSLPPDLREILVATARELTAFERKETIEREAAFLRTIIDSGVRVHTLSSEERQRFQEATAPVIEKYRQLIGGELLDKTAQLLREKYGPTAGDEIVIGLDADLTLGSARSGQAIRRGMELAVREINRQGGVLGKKFKIIARDHAGISARGIANMKFFARVDNLVAVMGGLHSPVALAELDIIHREKIIYLDPWAAATPIVENGFSPNYVFRVSVRDQYAGPFLVDHALRKYQRVALLLENTGWGRSNHRAMTAALAERKLTPTLVEWFNWGEEEMDQHLDRIERSGAQVILLVANSPEGINVIKGMAERRQKIPIISHGGITGGYFWEQTNKELQSVDLEFLQTFSFLAPENEDVADRVRESYFKVYGIDTPGKIVAPAGTAHAYDLVHLLARAIQLADSTDRPAIRDALERIDFYHGLVKDYSPPFTPERHDALDSNDFTMACYDRHGLIVPVDLCLESRCR
ncbi:MAG: DctP family TRAP transporter solute-binding subunit [Desulfobacterales bacterium]|nr:DctP family TRAP transporter solute-binding subunit [Desulfobacterales bacterium]